MLLSQTHGRAWEGAPAYEDLKNERNWSQHAPAHEETRPRTVIQFSQSYWAGCAAAWGDARPRECRSRSITELNTRPRACMRARVFWRLTESGKFLSFITFFIFLAIDFFPNFRLFRLIFLPRILVYIRISLRVRWFILQFSFLF